MLPVSLTGGLGMESPASTSGHTGRNSNIQAQLFEDDLVGFCLSIITYGFTEQALADTD